MRKYKLHEFQIIKIMPKSMESGSVTSQGWLPIREEKKHPESWTNLTFLHVHGG